MSARVRELLDWSTTTRSRATNPPISSLDVSIRAEILELLNDLVQDHDVGIRDPRDDDTRTLLDAVPNPF